MSTRTISTKLAIEGESTYRNALKNINSEYSTLKSQLSLVQSEFRENANSMEALEAKGKALAAMYASQEQKVKTLKSALENAQKAQETHAKASDSLRKQLAEAEEEMEKLKNSTGDTSKEQEELSKKIQQLNVDLAESEAKEEAAARGVNNWQKQCNTAQADLNDLSREVNKNNQYLEEARQSTDGCAISIDQYGKEVKEASQETKETCDAVQDLADVLASAGIAASVKEIASALYESAKAAASFADNILTLSQQTGISTTKLQEYSYAAELVDVSVDTITSTMRRNIKAMGDAQSGSATYAAAYEQLGVSVTNTDGSLRDSEEVYWEVLEALGQMQNETERDAVAMDLLGKSAQDLNPLILAGADTMRQLGEEAQDAGYVMSEDMLASAGALDDAIQRLTVSSDALENTIGTQLAPGFEALASAGVDVLQWGTNFLQQNEEIVPVLASLTVGVGAYAAAVAGLAIIEKIKKYLEGFNTALLANPYVIAAAAIATLTTAIIQYAASLEDLPEETQALADNVAEISEQYEAATGEVQDATAANKAYANSIFELARQERLSADDQAILQEQIERLNESVPELALAWDETTGALNMTEEAVNQFLDTQSGYKQYELAVNALVDAQAEAATITEQLSAAQEQLTEAQEAYDQSLGAGVEFRAEAARDLQSAKENVEALTAAQEQNNQTIADATENLEKYRDVTLETAESTEDKVFPINQDLWEQLREAESEYKALRQSAMDSINQQISAWQQMDNQAKTSAQTLNDALLSQIEYMDNYTYNMGLLLDRNIDGVEDLAEMFSDGSTESAAALAGLAEASDEEIEEIIANLERVEEGKEAFVDAIARIEPQVKIKLDALLETAAAKKDEIREALNDPDGFESIGINDAEGYRRGLESMIPAVSSTASRVSLAGQSAFKATAQQKSPSKAYEKIADNDAFGYIRGWEKKRNAVLDTIKTQGGANLRAMQAKIPTNEAVEAGLRAAESSRVSAIQSGLSATNSELTALLRDVSSKLDRLSAGAGSDKGYNIYFNDGVWAGKLAPAIDNALGDINRMKERGQ